MDTPKPTTTANQETEDAMTRRMLWVLKGSTNGMDEESIIAGAALLHEIETRQVLIHLLQTHQAHGWLADDGVVRVQACDGHCGDTGKP